MALLTHWKDSAPYAGTPIAMGEVTDPATGEVTTTVPFASTEDLDAIVASARLAAASWSTTSLSKRTEVLFRFRHLLATNADRLATIITAEHGKVHADALGEIARGLENVEFACGLANQLKGEFSSEVSGGVDVHSVHEALGVVVGITPFNFPLMVPLWMAANAIAAGNAFVLKPSEKDPSSSMALAELWAEAGLTAGVFNVVHGDAAAVGHLLTHPEVDAISFVGSTPVARSIYQRGTEAGKRVQALGGAKNHMVVLPDADLDLVADAAVSAGFGSAGERCMAVSIVVAVGEVADPMIAKISSRVAELKVGPGADPSSDMGPLITAAHRDKVASYLDTTTAQGGVVVIDGRDVFKANATGGFFLGPCLLDQLQPGMAAYDDEIFGPVLGVVRVSTFDEALALINANPYGNGTAIFTRDGGAARAFATKVSVGMVGINVPIPVPHASFSFGGWKDSLFGGHHIYGPEGFAFYTRSKVVTSRWPDPATSSVDLGFPQTR